MIDAAEARLRCIEAAAKSPTPNPGGYAVGVLESAQMWARWVLGEKTEGRPAAEEGRSTLGLPKKR